MRELKFKVIMNNGDIKYATLPEIRRGLPKSNSHPVKYLQFVGLFDRNGKEIYEGDVVSWDEGIVENSPSKEGLIIKDVVIKNGIWFEINGSPCKLNRIAEKCKVIGNIYENPELIR